MTTKAYLEAEDIDLLEGGALAYDRRERAWKPCLMYRLLIRLLFRLGCRVSEVLGISVDDIDFKQKRITIQHLKTRIKLSCPDCSARLSRTSKFCPSCGVKVEKAVASELEHRRQRALPVDDDTLQMLQEYVEGGGPLSTNGKQLLFGNRRGDIISQVTPGGSSGQQPIDVPREELPSRISRPEQGSFIASGGQTFLYSAYPLSRPDQTTATVDALIIAVPRGGALALWTVLYRPFLLAGLIALVVSLVIAILLARSVYRPIQRVTEAVEKIAQGQYDQEVPAAGPREVRRLAVSFNQMVEQVKQSQQRLRHFVADVSHQLRSPLTSIQGFAEAMLDGTADDEATRVKAATIINDESKRMRRQVDELLELARIQSGQLRIAREYVDVNELLEQCQEIMAVQAEEQSVLVKTRIEPHMTVYGDVDRLEQVFNNLLDNAIKNSPAKGEVIVNGRRRGTDSIEIHVIDDGPGIPPEQVPFVFDRFYQAGGIRTGVGLGLAIAKEIVVAHGGTIEASSTPGAGTEFIVRLSVGSPEPLEPGTPS